MIDHREQTCGTAIMKVRRMLPQPPEGVVRYIFVALRNAYSGSVPVSKRECSNGTLGSVPLFTSVKSGGLWHVAQRAVPLNRS